MKRKPKRTWLRQWREDVKGWTQAEAAAHFGVSRSRWSELEAGANPSGALARAITVTSRIGAGSFGKKTPLPRLDARR